MQTEELLEQNPPKKQVSGFKLSGSQGPAILFFQKRINNKYRNYFLHMFKRSPPKRKKSREKKKKLKKIDAGLLRL